MKTWLPNECSELSFIQIKKKYHHLGSSMSLVEGACSSQNSGLCKHNDYFIHKIPSNAIFFFHFPKLIYSIF